MLPRHYFYPMGTMKCYCYAIYVLLAKLLYEMLNMSEANNNLAMTKYEIHEKDILNLWYLHVTNTCHSYCMAQLGFNALHVIANIYTLCKITPYTEFLFPRSIKIFYFQHFLKILRVYTSTFTPLVHRAQSSACNYFCVHSIDFYS